MIASMSTPTRIGVIGGTGNEGRGLALRFAAAGARVIIGSRDASRAVAAAADLAALVQAPIQITGASNGDAIAQSDVVILAVPFAHAVPTITAHATDFVSGTLLLDVVVPMSFDGGKPRMIDIPEGSMAEALRAHLPEHVNLACAFKTLPARLLEHHTEPLECDDFVCGDSLASRERAAAVIAQIPGLRPVDCGGLEAARTLERMTWLCVTLNKRYKKHGARFKVLGI